MAVSEERHGPLDAIRENENIDATAHVCSGTRAEFNVSFPTFRRAFAFLKFARRSSDTIVLRMREIPQDMALNARAMVRVRFTNEEPAEELQTLLEFAYDTENVGV